MAITGISSIDNKQIIAAGALSATSANQALITSGGDSLQGLYDTVSTNSGSWTGGGDLSGYVKKDQRWLDIGNANYVETYNTATEKPVYDSFAFGTSNSAASTAVSFGSNNTSINQSFAQGNGNSAYRISFAQGTQNFASGLAAGTNSHGSFAQGFKNSAYSGSFAQGRYNVASGYSFAQGGTGSYSNSAIDHSFAQGARCDASACSFAQGKQCYAGDYSIAQGSGANASDYSQAFGRGTIASSSGMAIGTYNETDSAAFVIGNGTSNVAKSDAFIVYHDGSVSAAGKISANGVELGAGSEVPDEVMSAASAVSANSANWNKISAYQQASGSYLTEISGDILVNSVSLTGGSKQFETLASITGDSELKGVTISPDGITLRNDIEGNQDVNVTEVAKWNETTDTLSSNSADWSAAYYRVSNRSAAWNSNYTTVNHNSGSWGGSALPISAGPGISLSIVDNVLVISTAGV